MRVIILALSSIALISTSGCGSDNKNSDGRYNCGGPKEEPLAGEQVNQEAMKAITTGDGASGTTQPSGLVWSLVSSEDKEGEGFKLTVGDTAYYPIFGSESKWRIMLSKADDQIFGEFFFFRYTVASALDSSHCGTSGRRFVINHNGNEESYRHQIGIK